MVKLSLPHPIPITNPTSPFRNFNFMRPIKIVGSDTDLHDYQVRIHLDRSNFPLEKCKPDGSDIRFRDDSGEILPYWVERWNAAEGVIWCKIPFIPAESSKFIWMIYGNPNAKSESNGNAVFELFDVQGIVGFWHMDEPQWTGATGEVKDETGVNHGTAYGDATTTSDAKYGRAGVFDGENDYVDCGTDPSFHSQTLTWELWFKRNSATGEALDELLRNSYYKDRIAIDNANGHLYFEIGTTDNDTFWCDSGVVPVDGVWYHVVGTYDGQIQKIHVNGEFKNSIDVGKEILYSSGPLTIGYGAAIRAFNGIIDEVRIYNRALTPTEIQILSKNYMQKMGSYFNVRKYVTPAPVVIV